MLITNSIRHREFLSGINSPKGKRSSENYDICFSYFFSADNTKKMVLLDALIRGDDIVNLIDYIM